jgi:predicted acylesterase/phospholipase RssA
MRVWVSVADLISGEVLWFSNRDEGMTPEFFRSVVLGTMRIPVFWKPVSCSWRGREYQFVDPGLIMNIPIGKALERGFSNIVLIETVPKKFSSIPRLEMIGETDLRYSEINHFYESDSHLKWLGYINKNLEVLSEVEKVLSDSRVPPEISEAVRLKHAEYMFYGKRPINVCRINPPANLSIFKKTKRGAYGSPSLKARSELLGAGVVAAEEILLPFLKEQGLLLADAELPADWF